MSPTRDTEGSRAVARSAGGRRAGLVVLGLTAALTLPLAAAPATAQDGVQNPKLRAKDLGVVEQLLVQAVQEAVTERIRDINEEVRRSQVEAQQAGQMPEYRYEFRSAGDAGARGLFLEDYGAIFTVQVPHVSYTPSRALLVSPSSRNLPIVVGGRGSDALVAMEQARELQIRSQLNVLERSLAQLERMLEQETRSEKTSSLANQMASRITELEELQARLAEELRAQERNLRAARTEDDRREAEQREAEEREAEPEQTEPRGVASGSFWLRTLDDSEEYARARELAQDQKTQIEEAVLTGIIDTMAQYGTVIHGLADDDRIAVVLQPSSYLNDVQRWLRATDRAEEFVVSVRYGDVVELEVGDIDAEQFGERIRIESRLGQPRPAIRPRNRR